MTPCLPITAIAYHIVFSTKDRAPVLHSAGRPYLFRYLTGIIRNRQGHLYRINGVQDHLHMLTSVHPTVTLADVIKDLKTGSARWINRIFKGFSYWPEGYGAFTCSSNDLDGLIEYSKGQEEHDRRTSFEEEYRKLLREAGINFEERHLF
jgi:putative transposase